MPAGPAAHAGFTDLRRKVRLSAFQLRVELRQKLAGFLGQEQGGRLRGTRGSSDKALALKQSGLRLDVGGIDVELSCENIDRRYGAATSAIRRDLEARIAANELATVAQAESGRP